MVKMPVLAMLTYRYTEKLRFFYFEDFIQTNILVYCILRVNLKEKQNRFQNIILYKQGKNVFSIRHYTYIILNSVQYSTVAVSYTHLDVYKRQVKT